MSLFVTGAIFVDVGPLECHLSWQVPHLGKILRDSRSAKCLHFPIQNASPKREIVTSANRRVRMTSSCRIMLETAFVLKNLLLMLNLS